MINHISNPATEGRGPADTKGQAGKIRRSLDIEFSSEVGPRKGSWKGGTRGHSIDMELHDSHKSAFQRYCVEHNMTLVGVVQ